jgi:hypothetical protein
MKPKTPLRKIKKKKKIHTKEPLTPHMPVNPRSFTPSKNHEKLILNISDNSANHTNISFKTVRSSNLFCLKPKLSIINTPKPADRALQEKSFQKSNAKANSPGSPMNTKEKFYRLSPKSSPASQRSYRHNNDTVKPNKEHVFDSSNKVNGAENLYLNGFMLQYAIDCHTNNVSCIDVQRDTIYTGSIDYTVKKMRFLHTEPHPYRNKEYYDGEIIKNLSSTVLTHHRAVNFIELFNNTLFSSSVNGIVKAWTNNKLVLSKKISNGFYCGCIANSNFLCAEPDKIALFDLHKLDKYTNWDSGKCSYIKKVDNYCVLLGDRKGKVKLWDIRSAKTLIETECHYDNVTGIEIDGVGCLTCSEDGYLKHWDFRNWGLLDKQKAEGRLEKVVLFNNRIITGGDGLRVWNNAKAILVNTRRCRDIKVYGNNLLATGENLTMVWSTRPENKHIVNFDA